MPRTPSRAPYVPPPSSPSGRLWRRRGALRRRVSGQRPDRGGLPRQRPGDARRRRSRAGRGRGPLDARLRAGASRLARNVGLRALQLRLLPLRGGVQRALPHLRGARPPLGPRARPRAGADRRPGRRQKLPGGDAGGLDAVLRGDPGRHVGRLLLRIRPHGAGPRPILQTDHPTGVVFATDLSLLVPGFLSGGLLLRRRRPWGYVVSALVLVKASTYGPALIAMSAFSFAAGEGSDPFLPLWAFLTAGCLVACAFLLGNMRSGKNRAGRTLGDAEAASQRRIGAREEGRGRRV